MCGIVGKTGESNVVPVLFEGLKRLSYRGNESAGIAIVRDGALVCVKEKGNVSVLRTEVEKWAVPLQGTVGIAHTRWATHGKPSVKNAHPHVSCATIAVVHNGTIENYEEIRDRLVEKKYTMVSDTDSEVIAHLIHWYWREHGDLLRAVRETVAELRGAYAILVVSAADPGRIIGVRFGSPLVVGIGEGDREGEFFVASEVTALCAFTQTFKFLDEGDMVDINVNSLSLYDKNGELVDRPSKKVDISVKDIGKSGYSHYMEKEIHEQPAAIRATLDRRIKNGSVVEESFGENAGQVFNTISSVHIIACGTSYHAGMVAKYWFESLAKISCSVEVASEFRYREPVLKENTLYLTISQSGETADTRASLQEIKKRLSNAHTLVICNVPESSLVLESELALLTRAGPEIGVASTKAFTTQLTALMLLVLALGRRNGMKPELVSSIIGELERLPDKIEEVLLLEPAIHLMARSLFKEKREHVVFLGRGTHYPVALEGALKLKEITYIDANGYPSGELKHGPLALVDAEIPVIILVPNDHLVGKNKLSIEEVRARDGQLFVFADKEAPVTFEKNDQRVVLSGNYGVLAPIVYTVPLQLLAYHVAVLKGTDVDQPRNLAKSVTVE